MVWPVFLFTSPTTVFHHFTFWTLQQLYSLQLNLASAITLMGLVAVTVDYSVSHLNSCWSFPRWLAWCFLLLHSRATCPEIPQVKQWSHSSPLPRSLQLWQPQLGFFWLVTTSMASVGGSAPVWFCRLTALGINSTFEVVNFWFHLPDFRKNLLAPVWTWVPGSLFPSLPGEFASIYFGPFLVFSCQFCGMLILLWS